MVVYRIAGRKYVNDLSGIGAATYGGRWNNKGSAVLYTGETKEISLLETIVHTPPMLIKKLSILAIEIQKDSITKIEIKDLLSNWFGYSASTILSEISENWILNGDAVALKVPSRITSYSKKLCS